MPLYSRNKCVLSHYTLWNLDHSNCWVELVSLPHSDIASVWCRKCIIFPFCLHHLGRLPWFCLSLCLKGNVNCSSLPWMSRQCPSGLSAESRWEQNHICRDKRVCIVNKVCHKLLRYTSLLAWIKCYTMWMRLITLLCSIAFRRSWPLHHADLHSNHKKCKISSWYLQSLGGENQSAIYIILYLTTSNLSYALLALTLKPLP